jgi:hypothetical protein
MMMASFTTPAASLPRIYPTVRGSIVVKYYAASRKVAGSKRDEVKFYNLSNHSGLIRPSGSLSL